MINLPLPLKVNLNQDEEVSLRMDSSSNSPSTWEEVNVVNIDRTLNLIYPALTLSEANTVETALLSTKGTQRILYNNRKYLIKEGYECTIGNSFVSIKLTLVDVTGGLL